MADDFNSSDVEFEAPVNPFANAGLAAVSSLLQQGRDLRISSKKKSKELDRVGGAPGTLYNQANWRNTWETFFTTTLEKSIDTMPTEEDLERFLLIVPDIRKARSTDRAAVSWGLLQNALRGAVYAIRCRHDSFKLTFNGSQRVKDTFETLRRDNKITRDPVRDSQWISIVMINQLTRALIAEAVRYGTVDWSVVVQKCLGLALQSALSARSGDIMVSLSYEDHECLVFEDITLKIIVKQVPDDQPEPALLDRIELHAEFKLKHTKGKKRNNSKQHMVRLTSLDDVQYNAVDALKLLFVHAVRQGGIYGANTVEDAIAKLPKTGIVKWTFPDRPVLSRIVKRRLDFGHGAKTAQLLDTLNEAATLSGIMTRLWTHDSRRGAARDASQAAQPRRSMDSATEAMGHTPLSSLKGLTAKYVGHSTTSTLSERTQLPQDMFGLQAINAVEQKNDRKRRLDPKEVTEMLNRPENAYMKDHKFPRQSATKKLRLERDSAFAAARSGQDAEQSPTAAESDDVQNTDAVATFDTTNIDPVLLALSGIVPPPSNAAEHDETQQLESLALIEAEDTAAYAARTSQSTPERELSKLASSPSVFLPWLSRINTRVNRAQNAKAMNLEDPSFVGGSRDPPTLFVHYCKFELNGCPYSTTNGAHLDQHEKACTPQKAEAKGAMLVDGVELPCDQCSKYVARAADHAAAEKLLKTHKTNNHSDKAAQTCTIGGRPSCSNSFATKAAYQNHLHAEHRPIPAQTCPVNGCSNSRIWHGEKQLGSHLRHAHSLTGGELSKVMEAAKAKEV